MYLKDIDCPQLWQDKLSEVLPNVMFYLNESTGDLGGFGAVDENDPIRPGMKKGKGIGKAGDLMSSLPKEMRAENLMCYVGHEGTYTPAHREMCASLGQNIMIEASTGHVEDGKPTRPGSSIWFMTESKEREVVSEYWLSRLGHDIEIENHFAQVNAWKNAPFKVYVVEQKPGDFILIPPLAPHQVWNRGTRTTKVAWNRTTVETLEMALHEALPRARMVCRDEQYKNKAIIYYTMQKYSKLLRQGEKARQESAGPKQKSANDAKVRQLEKDFRRLQSLFSEILVSESFSPDKTEKKVELIPYDSNITCSYCRCNIFNRFLTCPNCVEQLANGDEDTYDICMDCYAMGRSCACISKLKWVEQWSWGELTQKHEQWRHQILQYEGKITEKSPMSLKTELDRRGNKRTLAQVCQLELTRRPFRDIRRPPSPVRGEGREEVEVVGPDGTVKFKKVKKTEKFMRAHGRCHTDCHWEPKWKQAVCTKCDKRYCYGTLFRRFDMMPQDILSNPNWTCPSCKSMCSCRNCIRKSGYSFKPYTPSGTMLGHNTKAVADPRSVESLVDFGISNLGWIQKADDDHGDQSRRLKKRRKDAEAAKANEPDLGEHYVDEDETMADDVETSILRLAQQEDIPIDPALGTSGVPPDSPVEDEDDFDENPESARRAGESTPEQSPAALPEGGVIRDLEHAYDQTEAITYDYPDPSIGLHVPAPIEEEQPALPPSYASAVPEEGGEIEMTATKRKRLTVDEGDRPYGYKKPNVVEKKKQRKSLIVKLSIPIEKLDEMEKLANLAQRALNGNLEGPAPVISSDLQALNAAEGNPQAAAKKVRRGPEHVEVERDDEFMPGRYRDRRKRAQGGLPPPDADITRRQTRMHQTHYEEPSEEEFNEMVEPRRKAADKAILKPVPSKVVRLDDAELNFDTADDSVDEDAAKDSSTSRPPVDVGSGPSKPAPRAATKAPKLTVMGSTDRTANRESTAEQSDGSASHTPSGIPFKMTTLAKPGSNVPVKASSKAVAEAHANRRAKMALIESMENDSDDYDDAWSQDSFLDEPNSNGKAAISAQLAPTKQPSALPARRSTSSDKSTSNSPAFSVSPPRVAPTMQYKSATNSHIIGSTTKTAIVSTVKASAADWVDSDDSDDEFPARGAQVGWAAVNSGSASASRWVPVKTGNHVGGGPAKRGRGRPPRQSM